VTRVCALFVAFLAAHLAQYTLFLGSWLLLGQAALAGAVTSGTLAGWAALMAGSALARVTAVRLQAGLAVEAGGRLRRRLLHGALRLDPTRVRREGTGHLLGRVLEAESIEDLAVGGALGGLAASLELGLAALLLAAALGPAALGALGAWLAVAAFATRRYFRHRGSWTAARMRLGNDLVEKMAGHRTRAVQQRPESRHDGEEAALAAYDVLGRRSDRWFAVLTVVVPRGWALAGAVLVAAVAGVSASPALVAAGAAGVFVGFGALTRLGVGLAGLVDAGCAWTRLRPLLPDRSARSQGNAPADSPALAAEAGSAVIEARAAGYRYPGRDRAVLRDVTLRVDAGDRVLIQGPSGSGKSTLAAVLSGRCAPTTGELRLHGVERGIVGEAAWRRRVLAVPQAEQNHLILGPLAMNLLLGRCWPAEQGDLRLADEVCRALGLGELLDRMPAGLLQLVGETGWRLSHGERSLVFLARALLQPVDVLVLDETFGAVDPHGLARAARVVAERAPTLMVIQH
jgi:ATP-binding cassette subfamily B protein